MTETASFNPGDVVRLKSVTSANISYTFCEWQVNGRMEYYGFAHSSLEKAGENIDTKSLLADNQRLLRDNELLNEQREKDRAQIQHLMERLSYYN